VRIVFLPTYSPELNPCEFVFAQVKRYLRDRMGTLRFWLEIIRGFLGVSADNMRVYYDHCLSGRAF